MMCGFLSDNESQSLVERTCRSIGLEDGKDDTAPACACIIDDLAGDIRPEAMPLMLGGNAERVEFKILTTFKRHKEADPNAAMLDYLRLVKLKLLLKLRALFAFIPKSTAAVM